MGRDLDFILWAVLVQPEKDSFWKSSRAGRNVIYLNRALLSQECHKGAVNTPRSPDKVDFTHVIPLQGTCWMVCVR